MSLEKNTDIKKAIRQNPGLSHIYRNIRSELSEVEKFMLAFSESANPLISEINSYIYEKKGKRIRPALLLLSSKLFNYAGDEHILLFALVAALHNASPIHDNIINNSYLRRWKITVHSKWGPNITVLLGDYVYIRTLGQSLSGSFSQVIHILSGTSKEMIDGELFEYYMTGNPGISEDQYLEIIQKKTAALFAASCHLGGILGGASRQQKKDLAEFGSNLGMSFQIIDDLLDYKGDEKTLGKPVLSDLSEGRVTLPLIYTMKNGTANQRKMIRAFMKDGNGENGHKQELLRIIRSNGALDYAMDKAEKYSAGAKNIIGNFPRSDHQEALFLISDYILVRNK